EVSTLSGRHALVDAHAEEDVETLLVPPEQLRALIIPEADLGVRIVRALILRRVGLIEAGASGPALIGEPQSPGVLRLQTFLKRNGYPHQVVDPRTDEAGAAMLEQYGAPLGAVLAVCPNGSVLLDPSEEALGRCLGMLDIAAHDELFDVAVVCAGPAGHATAVLTCRALPNSTAVACGTGLRLSKRRCASRRKLPSSAEATPPARRQSFWPSTQHASMSWCAGPASPRPCRAT